MKLRYSSTSPYARKVLVCAAERGLSETIEIIATVPGNLESGLRAENPLDKVPALITDDGMALYDSPVICEYLDSLPGGPLCFRPPGPIGGGRSACRLSPTACSTPPWPV